MKLEKIFACPNCRKPLKNIKEYCQCKNCGFRFKKRNGVWCFLNISSALAKESSEVYESLHQKPFVGPDDGSYTILAAIARGNKTVDIACGEGIIEELSPQTVGVEFSMNALKKARKRGVKHLVLADAQALPFTDNAFDVALSAGSLEHFENPQKAINEMARVSKIQVMTVHKGILGHRIISKVLRVKNQPIEEPLSMKDLVKMIENAGLHVVFKGVWTLPVNYGRVINFLPELKAIASCNFIISIKL